MSMCAFLNHYYRRDTVEFTLPTVDMGIEHDAVFVFCMLGIVCGCLLFIVIVFVSLFVSACSSAPAAFECTGEAFCAYA